MSVLDSVGPRNSVRSIEDVAYLVRSEHRVQALVAVADRPRSRAALGELTGVSASTIRRTLRAFETRNWVRRTGRRYEATALGEFVASSMTDVIDRFETELTLRDVWNQLPDETGEFALDPGMETTVTVADADDPYAPVNRFESVLRDADEIRFLGSEVALFEPCLEVFLGLLEEGIDATTIEPPRCTEYFVSTYPDRSRAAMRRENFTVLEHDDLPPYGVGLLDELVVVCCYEQNCGTVQVLVESDTPVAREWAESIYAVYEREARPPEIDALAQ